VGGIVGGVHDFGDIELLSPDQAKPVSVASWATKTGEIAKDDWVAIVAIISRLPDAYVFIREIEHIECFGDPAIAVRIQFPNYFIYLVKTSPSAWKVAKTCYVFPN